VPHRIELRVQIEYMNHAMREMYSRFGEQTI